MFTPFAFLVPQFNIISVPSSTAALFLGGIFYSYKTPPAVRIAKIQPNGFIDPTFITTGSAGQSPSGLNGNGRYADTQPDGKIIVTYGGNQYAGDASSRVVRINQNGSRDSSFVIGAGFGNTECWAIKCLSDFKTLFGGDMTTYSGSAISRIIRVNSSGSRDTTFNVGTGTNSTVISFDVQSDGKYIVGGAFTTYSGSSNNYIARVNTNGTKDTTFNIGTGFNGAVYDVKVVAGGKILVGGTFTSYSGSAISRIVRLNSNGTIDTTFTQGTGFSGQVLRLSIQDDQKILALGAFTSYSGSTNNRIIRINADGTKDSTFNVGTGFNQLRLSQDVGGIKQTSDGKVYVNGAFATYSGSTVNGIMRLNSNGTIDNTFNTSGSTIGYSTTEINNNYGAFLVTSGSSVITIGSFTSYREVLLNNLILLNTSGSELPQFDQGAGFNARCFFSLDNGDGTVLTSGFFTSYRGSLSSYFVKIKSDGTKDTTFNPGSPNSPAYTGFITGSQYMFAGAMSTYSGSTVNRIVRANFDGTRDTSFNPGTGFNGSMYKISPQSDGKIIAVGSFTTYSGSSNSYIARVNTNGTRDATFNVGTGFNSFPYDAIIQSDGKIVTAGSFSTYSGSLSGNNRIIRLNTNGTKDATFNIGNGFNGSVWGLFQQSDGKIIVVGNFTTYNGSTNNSIVRINADGTKDNTFNIGVGISTNFISSFTSNDFGKFDSSGNLYLGGGRLLSYSGSNVGGVVKITPSGSIDQSFSTSGSEFNGFDGAAFTITPYNI